MAKPGRKSEYEELRIKESLAEITPMMFEFVKHIMLEGTDTQKMQIVTKVLPKVVDKALPNLNEHTGADGTPIQVIFDNTFQQYGCNSTQRATEDSTE